MDCYKVLNNQNFKNGEFEIIPIRWSDRFDILKWRNDQMYHLRQSTLITPEMQEQYFRNVIAKIYHEERPNQILFTLLKNKKAIGYGGLVHINWQDRHAEISFLMDTDLENDFFEQNWLVFLFLIEKVAFIELKFHKIFTYAYDLRPHLYPILNKSGFFKDATLKDHCFFNNKFIDVIIHSKINLRLNIRRITNEDKMIVFEWSNDKVTRENSFNSDPITFESHSAWFDSKIVDKNAFYYIVELEGAKVGLVRLDLRAEFDICEIGVLIDEKFRGKGLASKIIELGCNEFYKENIVPIVAKIKAYNFPSIKAFEKAGFLRKDSIKNDNLEIFEYEFRKK